MPLRADHGGYRAVVAQFLNACTERTPSDHISIGYDHWPRIRSGGRAARKAHVVVTLGEADFRVDQTG